LSHFSIGTPGLSYFAFQDGKECFEKAKSENIVLANINGESAY
jgi:hypothetical protein